MPQLFLERFAHLIKSVFFVDRILSRWVWLIEFQWNVSNFYPQYHCFGFICSTLNHAIYIKFHRQRLVSFITGWNSRMHSISSPKRNINEPHVSIGFSTNQSASWSGATNPVASYGNAGSRRQSRISAAYASGYDGTAIVLARQYVVAAIEKKCILEDCLNLFSVSCYCSKKLYSN